MTYRCSEKSGVSQYFMVQLIPYGSLFSLKMVFVSFQTRTNNPITQHIVNTLKKKKPLNKITHFLVYNLGQSLV
jgi:hypothetical protein